MEIVLGTKPKEIGDHSEKRRFGKFKAAQREFVVILSSWDLLSSDLEMKSF